MAEDSPTRRTVLIAGAANLFVGVIKLAAGILVGSSAMLAEAAHSVADTLNQAFLLASLNRSERPADSRHPFGYGQERYFWSLLAAFGIFIAGAGFSIFEGLLALTREHSESPLIAYLVLAAAGLAEGASLARVLIQYRSEARRSHTEILDQVQASPDLTVRTALFEDSAAMVGLVLAALGLALRQATGSPVWDGAASMAIGVLLIVVAVRLGMDSRDYLIGRAAGSRELDTIRAEIEQTPGVDKLLDLSTMYLGPEHLIVAAKVAFGDEISADRAEDIADEIDKRLSDRLPVVPHVFLDPTQAAPSAQLSAGCRGPHCRGFMQARVDLQPAIKAHHGHDSQDPCGRHHAQLAAACGPPLGGLHQRADPARVTELGSCHVRDDGCDPGSKGRLKILAETASVPHVDLGGHRDHCHSDRSAGRGLCFDHGATSGFPRRGPGDG